MADDIRSDIIINVDTSVGIAEIKNLQRQISQLNAQLLQSGARQARAAQDIQNNLIRNINATGKFAANVRTISTTAESFTTALERNKLSMGEYFRYAGASTKTFGRLFKNEFDTINKVARERVKTLQTQYIKLGRDANGALKAIAVRPLALDMDNLATKTAIAAQRQQLFNQLLKQGSTNLLNFGKNTQWAGRQLMVGFTIPLAMMGTAAVREFKKIEQQAIRFKRVYGDAFSSEAETTQALENVKKLADEFTKYGVEVEKTLALAADAAQMGLKSADLLAQVTQATRLAVLGEVEQQEALKTTISITNAFGISAADLAQKINFLNSVENETVTAIEDLTIAIPKAGPVVKQLGGDVEDLAFFLTAMKEGGINASEGANALKSGLASLINPTDKASEMLAGLGINIKGIVEANKGDIKGIVIGFAQALDTLDPLNRARAIEQLFGKFQFARLSTLFQNVVKEGNQASRVLELASLSTEKLAIVAERELKRVEDSPLFKFQKQLEKFQAALAPVGEEFLKAITPIVEFGAELLKKFNGMSDGAKQFAVVATTVVAGIGPVFLMMFGLIANGAANIIKLFANMMRIFTGAGKGSRDLGLSTEYMTQQQLEAAAVAASLNQTHSKLVQTFTAESAAVNTLATSYARAVVQQSRLLGVNPETGAPLAGGRPVRAPRRLAKGIVSVPGPKGAGDIVPAMLSPGEAVIPAKQSAKYAGLISGMINDDIPGFRFGRNPFAGLMKKLKPEGAKYNILEGVLRMMTGTRTDSYGNSTYMYRDAVAKKFLRSNPNIAVRMPADKLIQLAQSKDKRYKSVFETGFSQAGDTAIKRAAAEQKLFNLPLDADPRLRPVYGYLFKEERGLSKRAIRRPDNSFKPTALSEKIFESLTGKKIPLGTSLSSEKRLMAGHTGSLLNPKTYMYGNIAMVLNKRAVKNRTTFTYGDSYNSWANQYATPAPLGTQSAKKIKAAYTSRDKSFFEAQILGGFTLKDVKKIITTEPALIPQLQAVLRANGLNIPVRMPRFTMMQRLRKFVYGKRAIADRLPFTAQYGPKAGKYTNPPIKVGNKKLWLNQGIQKTPKKKKVPKVKTPKQSQSKARFFAFPQDATIEGAHMSGGTSLLNKRQIIRLFDRQLDSADRNGLLKKFGMNKDAIRLDFENWINSDTNKNRKQFALFSNMVEPTLKQLNQKFSRSTNRIDASFVKTSLENLPAGMFGSGIRSRLPEGHGIPNNVLDKYARDLSDEMIKRVSSLGNRKIVEKDLHKIYREAERVATSKIKNISHRQYITDINTLSRYLLTPAFPNSGGDSGKTRAPLSSLFGNVQNSVTATARTSFPQFLTKNGIKMPEEARQMAEEYKKTLSKNKELDFYRKLINESNKDGVKNYLKVIEDHKAGIKTPAKAPATPVSEKPPRKDIPSNIFSMKRILGRGAGIAGLASIFGLMFGGNNVLKAANGVFSVPGPKGAGDVVPAMLSPGESVIPAKQSQKYAPLVSAMINDSVPGYMSGRVGKNNNVEPPMLTNRTPQQQNRQIQQSGKLFNKEAFKPKAIAESGKKFILSGAKALAAKVENSPALASATARIFGNNIVTTSGREFAGGTGAEIRTDKRGRQYGYIPGQGTTSVAKAQAAMTQQQTQKPVARGGSGGMGMMMAGGSLSLAGGFMMANEDPKMQAAGNALMFGGIAMSILPLLANANIWLKIATGIAAMLGGFFLLNEELKKATRSGIEAANAMSMTSEKLIAISEITGTVSATQAESEKRKNLLTGVAELDRKFGMDFLSSEVGKNLLADIDKQVAAGIQKGEISKNIGLQLAEAITQGVLTQDEARSIAAALGTQLKDYTFSMSVTGMIAKIIGPNGEDLTKEPLTVALRIQAESMRQVQQSIETAKAGQKDPFTTYTSIQDTPVSASAQALGQNALGTAIAGGAALLTGVGAPVAIGLFVSSLVMAVGAAGQYLEIQKKNNELMAMAIARAGEEVALNQQRSDAIKDSFEGRIQEEQRLKAIADENLKAAKTDEERAKFRQQIADADSKIAIFQKNQSDAVSKFNAASANQYDQLTNYLTELRKNGGQIDEVLNAALETRYKDDPLGMEFAKKNLESIKAMTDEGFKSSLQLAVVSGTMSESTISTLIRMGENNETMQAKFQLLISQQGVAGLDTVTQLLNQVGVGQYAFSGIFESFIGKDPEAFDERLAALSALSGVEAFGFDINLDERGNDKINNVLNTLNELENIEDPITKETIVELAKENPELYDAVLADWNKLVNADGTIYRNVLIGISATGQSDEAVKQYLATFPVGSKERNALETANRMPSYAASSYLNQYRSAAGVYFAPAGDKTIDPDDGKGTNDGTTGGTRKDPYEDILKRLKQVRDAVIKTKGGLKELNSLFGKGAEEMEKFVGIDQQLLSRGANRAFMDFVSGLDEIDQPKFIKITKDGIVSITNAGKQMIKALNEAAIGDYQIGLKLGTKEAINQSVAFNKLTNAGMSAFEALEAVKDPAFAAAAASKDISPKELASLAEEANYAQNVIGKVAARLQLVNDINTNAARLNMQDTFRRNTSGYSVIEQMAIESDSTLTQIYQDFLSGVIKSFPDEFKIRMQQVMDSIEFKQKVFEDGFNKAMEAFAAQEEKLRIDMEFELQGFTLEGVVGKGARQILADAQDEIAKLQFRLDDLNAGIQEIEWQENEVNEKYDKRLEALDKIEQANRSISAQQKAQLTLADALSQGDISAAAKAVQEIRQQQAEDAISKQRDLLEISREKELAGLRAQSGRTRKELEASILEIQKQIFKIEEQRLEPAAEAIRQAEAALQKNISTLTVLGKTRLEWESIKNGIDIAVTSSEAYEKAMEAALGVVTDIVNYWNSLDNKTIKTTHEITTVHKTVTDGGGTTGGGTTSGGTTSGGTTSGGTTSGGPTDGGPTKIINEEWTKAKKALDDAKAALQKWDKARSDLDAQLNNLREDLRKARTDSQRTNIENQILALQKKTSLYPGSDRKLLLAAIDAAQKKLNSTPQYITKASSVPTVGGGSGGGSTAMLLMANGGLVPKYMRMGGLLPYKSEGGSIFKPLGTDTVPAMLTPGEFVVRKYAVNKFGVDRLKAINNGTYGGDSMYNYEVNVNVQTDANPDQIARAVIGQIKQIESQRIRGNRF